MSMFKKKALAASLTAAVLSISSSTAFAVEQGDWLVRFGFAHVSPNDGSSGVVADDAIGVDSDTQLFVNGTYMIKDYLGLELLASTPFTHDITLDGVGKIAETKQLPPTLSVQYHFRPKETFRPYVGLGVNYTIFFDETTTAVINSLDIDNSFGLAAQLGMDVDINKNWYFNADLRYINIETTAKTDLGNIDVEINPWVLSLGVGTRF